MSYKTILAPMIFEETARIVAEAAIIIAGADRGHVIGKHIRQNYYYYPPMAYGSIFTSVPPRFDQAISDAARSFAEAQESLFDEICDDAGVHRVSMLDAPRKRGVTASWSDEDGIVPDRFGQAARVADLSIAAVPGKRGGSHEVDLIETLLVSSGKPVFLVPKTGLDAYPENILMCWDGSRSAARAIDAARPFLKAAKSVRIITLKDVDHNAPSLDDAVAHLGMLGINAVPDFIARPKGGLAKRILDEANNADSELIVMGGYSHRRFNEAIFGGVTRYMLDHSDRALLMAHQVLNRWRHTRALSASGCRCIGFEVPTLPVLLGRQTGSVAKKAPSKKDNPLAAVDRTKVSLCAALHHQADLPQPIIILSVLCASLPRFAAFPQFASPI